MTACIRTIYRRPLDTDAPWQPFASMHGTKREALAMMQEFDKQAGETEWEWQAMEGNQRPQQFQKHTGIRR